MIELDKLTRILSGNVAAVDSLSLEVEASQVYGLLGPNDAGKTTRLRMIWGLLCPTSGDRILGCSVSQRPFRPAGLGFIR